VRERSYWEWLSRRGLVGVTGWVWVTGGVGKEFRDQV